MTCLPSRGGSNGGKKGESLMTSETDSLSGLRMKPTTSSGQAADLSQRNWLAAVSTTSRVRVVATCVPFIAAMSPREWARGFGVPVEVTVADFKQGELHTVAWQAWVAAHAQPVHAR